MMLRMPSHLTASSQASSMTTVTRTGHTTVAVCFPSLSGMARLDGLAKMANEAVERFVLGHRDVSGPRKIDGELVDDGRRPAAHHQDAVGQERRFADAVGDENHRLAIGLPNAQKLDPHLVARDRVQRAERLG